MARTPVQAAAAGVRDEDARLAEGEEGMGGGGGVKCGGREGVEPPLCEGDAEALPCCWAEEDGMGVEDAGGWWASLLGWGELLGGGSGGTNGRGRGGAGAGTGGGTGPLSKCCSDMAGGSGGGGGGW